MAEAPRLIQASLPDEIFLLILEHTIEPYSIKLHASSTRSTPTWQYRLERSDGGSVVNLALVSRTFCNVIRRLLRDNYNGNFEIMEHKEQETGEYHDHTDAVLMLISTMAIDWILDRTTILRMTGTNHDLPSFGRTTVFPNLTTIEVDSGITSLGLLWSCNHNAEQVLNEARSDANILESFHYTVQRVLPGPVFQQWVRGHGIGLRLHFFVRMVCQDNCVLLDLDATTTPIRIVGRTIVPHTPETSTFLQQLKQRMEDSASD